jgi:PIN domain nuclease of toxin-antitoxin system
LASKRYERYLSVASAWEIAIKWRRGRLRLPEEPRRFVPATLQLSGVAPLAVELSHALCVASLPLHHSDPFDRLLVAQTQMEGLSLLSADPVFDAYGVDNLWT